MIATKTSEKASETIKKFCTVRNGRKVKTDRITRIFPKIHRTTRVESTIAIGNALANAMGTIVGDDDDDDDVDEIGGLVVRKIRNRFVNVDVCNAMMKFFVDIKYQSIEVIFNRNKGVLSFGRREESC